jgi:hypothetical protein
LEALASDKPKTRHADQKMGSGCRHRQTEAAAFASPLTNPGIFGNFVATAEVGTPFDSLATGIAGEGLELRVATLR